MISDADTIGVFQVESRAQMTMLPRLRPRCFYDLVIEVAIVRPGPIQGNMVHPYLRRRNGEEKVTYPSEELREVLEKTLGVPLFQEQAMQLAVVAAGFTPEEADELRRSMASWKRVHGMSKFHGKFVNGMLARGYDRTFAEQCFEQINGFGEYGFPESHSASFARLVYVSAWLKRYYPAAFACALLNSQPMGFYAPAQLVRDAVEHGVEARDVDVNASEWPCTLEESNDGATERSSDEGEDGRRRTYSQKWDWGVGGPALRLGFRRVKGLSETHARHLVEVRQKRGPFTSIAQLHSLTRLPKHVLKRLAEADAFGSMGLTRRRALWEVLELADEEYPLFEQPLPEPTLPFVAPSLGRSVASDVSLPDMPLQQEVLTDYATTGHSLKLHPVALVREQLKQMKVVTAQQLAQMSHGRWVKVAGLVLIRQRPGTASGIVFETLEDETGISNLVVRPHTFDAYRSAACHAALLAADGYVERQGQVVHVMVKRLYDLSGLIRGYSLESRDFH